MLAHELAIFGWGRLHKSMFAYARLSWGGNRVRQQMKMTRFISLYLPAFRSPALVTVQAQGWLLPREDNFSHMFLTFIPSNGPICLSKCVCCVLFPARFVPMPSLQWAPLSPGVRAEASRYLYRPNSWGPPSQSSERWVEELSWKLQVKPSVGNVSLSPQLSCVSLFLAVICLPPLSVQSGQVVFSSGQPDHRTNVTYSDLIRHPVYNLLFISLLFSPFIHSATHVFQPIFLLWNTLCSPASN